MGDGKCTTANDLLQTYFEYTAIQTSITQFYFIKLEDLNLLDLNQQRYWL